MVAIDHDHAPFVGSQLNHGISCYRVFRRDHSLYTVTADMVLVWLITVSCYILMQPWD